MVKIALVQSAESRFTANVFLFLKKRRTGACKKKRHLRQPVSDVIGDRSASYVSSKLVAF